MSPQPITVTRLRRLVRSGFLEGVVDLHLHTAPDTRARLLDDFECVNEAALAGFRGLAFKNHYTRTPDRAAIATRWAGGGAISIFGSVTLNETVGGLNQVTVEKALQLGARIVWMPTHDALHHRRYFGDKKGIQVIDPQIPSQLLPAAKEIVAMARDADAIVASGHISPAETYALARFGAEVGAQVVVTHPEYAVTQLTISMQKELAELGALFERVAVTSTATVGRLGSPVEALFSSMMAVGYQSSYVASDLGQAESESPVLGMARFLLQLSELGASDREIRMISRETPQRLMGIV